MASERRKERKPTGNGDGVLGDSADSYVMKAEEKMLEAFFAGKLSENGQARVLSWLAKELDADVTVVEDAVHELLTAKPGQWNDARLTAKIESRLRAELLIVQPQEPRKLRKITPRPSTVALPFSQGLVGSVGAAMRMARSAKGRTTAAETILVIVDPDRSTRQSYVHPLRRLFLRTKTVDTVDEALKVIDLLPKSAAFKVVHRGLSEAARRSLQEALRSRENRRPL